MNDFTKEDLKDINYSLETSHLGNSDLRKKVLNMIEHYCEHERDNYHPPEIDKTEGYQITSWKYKCIKCGAFYR